MHVEPVLVEPVLVVQVEVRLAQGKAGSHCCDTIITYTRGTLSDPHAVIVVLQMDNTKATACFRQDLIRPAFTAYTQVCKQFSTHHHTHTRIFVPTERQAPRLTLSDCVSYSR